MHVSPKNNQYTTKRFPKLSLAIQLCSSPNVSIHSTFLTMSIIKLFFCQLV